MPDQPEDVHHRNQQVGQRGDDPGVSAGQLPRQYGGTASTRPKSDFTKESLDSLFIDSKSDTKAVCADGSQPDVQVKIAGFGGKGVLSLGTMIAQAGLAAYRNVSWYPSYLPRTARRHLELLRDPGDPRDRISRHLSSGPAGGDEPPVNREVQERREAGWRDHLRRSDGRRGDSRGVRGIAVPAQQLADEGGNPKGANTVMFGLIAASASHGCPRTPSCTHSPTASPSARSSFRSTNSFWNMCTSGRRRTSDDRLPHQPGKSE